MLTRKLLVRGEHAVPAVVEQLDASRIRGGDDGGAAGHRFEIGKAEPLVRARRHVGPRTPIERCELGVLNANPIGHAGTGRTLVADDRESRIWMRPPHDRPRRSAPGSAHACGRRACRRRAARVAALRSRGSGANTRSSTPRQITRRTNGFWRRVLSLTATTPFWVMRRQQFLRVHAELQHGAPDRARGPRLAQGASVEHPDDRLPGDRQEQAVAVRHDRVELAVVREDGQHVAQISHGDPPAEPRADERFPGKSLHVVASLLGLRVVREHHHLVATAGKTVRQHVGGSLDAPTLQPRNRQAIAERGKAEARTAGWHSRCSSGSGRRFQHRRARGHRRPTPLHGAREHVVRPLHLPCEIA